MKMYVLLLLICVSVAKTLDSHESKYIDLLPDKEKYEFIEKVARRIMENIETKETTNKSGVEVPEDELKEHEAYVKQILKDEFSNIRRNKINKPNETLKSEGDIGVKSLKNSSIKKNDDDLNLTKRNKRIKRNNEGSRVSEIPIKLVTENVKSKSTSSASEIQIKYGDEVTKVNKDDQSSKEDIQVRSIRGPALEHNVLKTENFGAVVNEAVRMPDHLTNSNEKFHQHSTLSKDKFQGTMIVKPAPKTVVIKSENVGIEVIESTTTMTDSIGYKNDTDRFKLSEQDVSVKYLDRRAGQNSKVPRDKSYTTDEVDVDNTVKSETKSQQITIFDTFELEIQGTSTVDSNQYKTIDSSLENSTDDATAYNTTERNESIETNQVTQTMYDSELESDKSDNDNLNETTDLSTLKDTVMTTETYILNNTVFTDTVSFKKNLRSNQKSSYTEVNKLNNTERSDYKITGERNIHDRKPYSTANTAISSIHKTKINSVNYKNANDNIKLSPKFHTNDEITTSFNSVKETENNIKETVTLIEQTTIKTDYSEMSVSISPVIAIVTVKNDTNIEEKNPAAKTQMKKHYKLKSNVFTMSESNDTTAEDKFKDAFLTTTESNNVMNVNNDKYKNVASKALRSLKERVFLLKGDKKNTKINKNDNRYQVYEIPADKPSFTEKIEIAKEQPYYIPIYNYSPNKAYFNAENRLGPNYGDDLKIHNEMETELYNIDDIVDSKTDSINEQGNYDEDMADFKKRSEYRNDDYFDRSDNQRKKFGKLYHNITYTKPVSKVNQSHSIFLPLFVQKPIKIKKFNENYYNPYDYIDLEYSNRIARANCKESEENLTTKKPFFFPNSDEESHPYRSIKEKNLKNHIRAVRNVLYENQWFDNPLRVKKVTTAAKEEEDDNREQTKYFRNGGQRGIALDYYFGRMKSKASKPAIYYKKVGYIKNDNYSDNIYMNSKFINNNLIKYINAMKYKGKTYINEDYMTATPHSEIIEDVVPKTGIIQRNLEKLATEKGTLHEMKTIEKNLSVTDERDFMLTLEKLQAMNISLSRNKQENLNVYLSVLKDMVRLDNNALQQYDWLGTTVDVQSALRKLLELMEGVQTIRDIHPSDLELLKYVIFLHKFSYEAASAEKTDKIDKLRKDSALPKNKKKKKGFLNDKGLIDRVWLYLRNKKTEDEGTRSSIDNLNEFLIDLQNNLFDLHEAMKNIALITKYKKQNWFKNMKELYITDDRSYLSILLHLAVTRLFELVEKSAENGAEMDFRSYVRENRDETTKSVDEIHFIMNILDKIKEY